MTSNHKQLIKIAVILETTVSELLGTKVENEEEPDRLAKELSRINTQLAIRNHRMRHVLKTIAVALLVFVALIFVIMALNYAPMSQSKYTKEDENGFFIKQPYNGIFSIEEKQYAEIFETLFSGAATKL